MSSAGPPPPHATERLLRLSAWLRRRFGQRVFKVSLRGGFSCPNRDGTLASSGCAFCADEALLPSGYRPEMDLAEQLAAGMAYVEARHRAGRFIAYFQDHSATHAPLERLAAAFALPLAAPRVVGLAVGTRPDCLAPEVVALLARLAAKHLVWLELGLQIADDGLLARLGRQHDVAAFVDAVRRCQHDAGIPVCAHVIVGLPGATAELERRTARLLGDLGVWGVKLHAFVVLRGAPLALEHAAGRLALLEDRAVHAARVVDLLERLPSDTVIHRLTGEAARQLTIAPAWTVNKMAVHDAVLDELVRRDSWQGKALGAPRPLSG